MGFGHLTAAKNTAEILRRLYGEKITLTVIDFPDYVSGTLNKAVRLMYYTALKISPKTYKLLFSGFDNPISMKGLSTVSMSFAKRRAVKLLNEEKPDLIFSTWPILDPVLRKAAKNIPFVSMITDSGNVHHAWTLADPDFYIVTDDITKNTLESMGVDTKKIQVLGFPVNPSFFDNANEKKTDHTTDAGAFRVLMLTSRSKHSRDIKIVEALKNTGGNLLVTIVTGKDTRLENKLRKIHLPKNFKILGWTDNVVNLMCTSDLILTKSGGAVLQECVAAKKPVIIHDSLPGQEEGNVKLVEISGMGIVMHKEKPEDIAKKILELSSPKNTLRESMQKNAEKLHKNRSTQSIGNFLWKLLKKKMP